MFHGIRMYEIVDRITVRYDEPDVLVLLAYYTSRCMLGESAYMHAGHATPNRNRQRFIQGSFIVEKVGRDLSDSLPAAHALTGCDMKSS